MVSISAVGTLQGDDARTKAQLALGRWILESSRYAVVVVDAGDRVRYLNSVAERLLGHRLKEVYGWPQSALVTLAEMSAAALSWLPGWHADDKRDVAVLIQPDGHQIAVLVRRTPLPYSSVHVGWVIALRDISALYAVARHASGEPPPAGVGYQSVRRRISNHGSDAGNEDTAAALAALH